MKHMKKSLLRTLTLTSAFTLALSGVFAEAAETQATPVPSEAVETQTAPVPAVEEDPVVITFNGEEIHWSEITDMAAYLASSGHTQSEDDYAAAYTTLLNQHVLEYKMADLGFMNFTEEEEADIAAKAQQQWDDAIASYVNQFTTSETPTDEELATLRANAQAYFTAYGVSLDSLTENEKTLAGYEKLEDYLAQTQNIAVTDEEVAAVYQGYVNEDRSYFEGNVPMYEYYTQYMGYEVFYTPEGFRGVLQILLDVDADLLSAYQEKLTAYEAQQASAEGETPAENPVTLEDVEAARSAVLESRKDTIDEINSRLAAGEEFIALISDYNIDPGMQNEAYLASGYQVAADSVLYDKAFIAAAFDENMTEVGKVSNPSVGKYGIYIVYYLRDVPAGEVPMSENSAATIRSNLTTSKMNQAFSALVPQWLAECDVTVDAETIHALSGLLIENGVVVGQEDELVPAAEEAAPAAEEAAPAAEEAAPAEEAAGENNP